MSEKNVLGTNEAISQEDNFICKKADMSNQEDPIDDDKVLEYILANYDYRNRLMASELRIASDHPGLTGDFRENMWMNFFRSIIPLKYSLAKGVKVIDSDGKVSCQVDIAVFDEQFTPYVFQHHGIKYIPIEAVVIVIECKSTGYDLGALKDWSKSIDNLNARPTGIARMATGNTVGFTSPTQIKTRPIRILASMKKFVGNQTIDNTAKSLIDHFDFIVMEKNEKELYSFEYMLNYEENSLGWWGHWLNKGEKLEAQQFPMKLQFVDKSQGDEKMTDEAKVKYKEERQNELTNKYKELKFNSDLLLINKVSELRVKNNPLLSLNFQLNQLLMLVNNPMMFPHFAYATRFNEGLKKDMSESSSQKMQGGDD